ncbi:MAG: ankyrin repeat domain-containing protein [Chthoniobacteraceae bacterium]
MHTPRGHHRKGLIALALLYLGSGLVVSPAVEADQARARLDFLNLEPSAHTLSQAILARQPPIVELLLSAHADVNGDAAEPPLIAAALASNWKLIPRLLEAGADANVSGSDGVTPLMASSARGDLECVNRLLAEGARLDAVDRAGRTAVHYAIAGLHPDVAQHLLSIQENGAPDDAYDSSLLSLAVAGHDWKTVAPLLERLPGRRAWDSSARSALALALKSKNVEDVRLVLSKFKGPPAPEGHHQPLLAYAAAVNDLALGRLLVEAGANPDTLIEAPIDDAFMTHMKPKFMRHYVSEEPGMSTLMIAAGLGHADFVRLLLDHGAARGLATTSKYRLVALYFAAWGDSAECQQALLTDAPSPREMRVDINLSAQNAILYKEGVPVYTTDISSGRQGYTTPAGRYVITDKKRNHISSIYKVKMPFFMRLSCKDFGLHEGYVSGSPASHGCIRLPAQAAKKMFQEVPIGTLVTISN